MPMGELRTYSEWKKNLVSTGGKPFSRLDFSVKLCWVVHPSTGYPHEAAGKVCRLVKSGADDGVGRARTVLARIKC